MGSFFSSAAGAAGEVDHAARSPTIEECTRSFTNRELAKIGYDPVSYMARVDAVHRTIERAGPVSSQELRTRATVSFQELRARAEASRPTFVQDGEWVDAVAPVSFQELTARADASRPTFVLLDGVDAVIVCRLVHCALKHYNSKNPGANFQYPAEPTTEMKATSISFRERFWYHVGFSACRRNADADDELQYFFAELRFSGWTNRPVVQTCTILEKPLRRFRSRCAFCTDESKILHPSDTEFECGKEGHEQDKRDMLVRLIDPMRDVLQS